MEQDQKPPFELSDIEDVRIIIKANGKHYSLVPVEGKNREDAFCERLALALAIVDPKEKSHAVCDRAVEDIVGGPIYAVTVDRLSKEYEKSILLDEQTGKLYKTVDRIIEACGKVLDIFREKAIKAYYESDADVDQQLRSITNEEVIAEYDKGK